MIAGYVGSKIPDIFSMTAGDCLLLTFVLSLRMKDFSVLCHEHEWMNFWKKPTLMVTSSSPTRNFLKWLVHMSQRLISPFTDVLYIYRKCSDSDPWNRNVVFLLIPTYTAFHLRILKILYRIIVIIRVENHKNYVTWSLHVPHHVWII